MTVTSKFDYKQRIYWMESNKVRSAIVVSIQFGRYYRIDGREYLSEPMYFVSGNTKSSVINWSGGGLPESKCFASKNDLLKSL
jgi:hypothetical protein